MMVLVWFSKSLDEVEYLCKEKLERGLNITIDKTFPDNYFRYFGENEFYPGIEFLARVSHARNYNGRKVLFNVSYSCREVVSGYVRMLWRCFDYIDRIMVVSRSPRFGIKKEFITQPKIECISNAIETMLEYGGVRSRLYYVDNRTAEEELNQFGIHCDNEVSYWGVEFEPCFPQVQDISASLWYPKALDTLRGYECWDYKSKICPPYKIPCGELFDIFSELYTDIAYVAYFTDLYVFLQACFLNPTLHNMHVSTCNGFSTFTEKVLPKPVRMDLTPTIHEFYGTKFLMSEIDKDGYSNTNWIEDEEEDWYDDDFITDEEGRDDES